MCRTLRLAVLLGWALAAPVAVLAHPAPFSYVDLRLDEGGLEGSLTAHNIDLAHELGVASPERLLDERVVQAHRDRLFDLVLARLSVRADDSPVAWRRGAIRVVAERQSVRFTFSAALAAPAGALRVQGVLFPYDPNHQTFVNVYENGRLRHQAILDRTRSAFDYYRGTSQGTRAVVRRFLASGIHHIVIGPDHVLFLVGLLLLGGTLWRLLTIVTGFTLAHSITLSLAALDLVAPPAQIVEPAIALSIIYVGADNLLVAREGQNVRDVRGWIALAFGLIHGFAFAGILKETGLPPEALGWSLASFNVGVELGQVAIVVVVASIVAVIRRRDARLSRWTVTGGSIAVVCAGVYWFVERVFFA